MPERQPPEALDPFGESAPLRLRRRLDLLGCRIEFLADSPALFELVDAAYSGLPALRLDERPVELQVRLVLREGPALPALPAEPTMQGGPGLLCAIVDADNHAIVMPAQRQAQVTISRGLLAYPYNARYELLEFAVFTLAARARCLLPLHAGCVGRNGQGLLLIGLSGAGKSTLSLHAMQRGMDFLTEDASFLASEDLAIVGISNFLHLRDDALDLIEDAGLRAQVSQSPRIRRRSGVEKYELDLRQSAGSLAAAPLKLAGLVFIDRQAAGTEPALQPLARPQLLEGLAASQPYARGQVGWEQWAQQLSHLPAHVLRRSPHPREGARLLDELLASLAPA